MNPIFLTPKWLVGHVLVLTVLISFTNFGAWQLRRHDARLERNAVAIERMAEEPADLDAVVARALATPPIGGVDPLAYRRVTLTGTFDPAVEVLRRPVSRDGMPGYHVITPLVLADGSAVLVERGWVPQSLDRVPVVEASPPEGKVTIVGWTFPTERPPTGPLAGLVARDPAEGPLRTVVYVDEERLAAQMPHPLRDVLVLLDPPRRPPGDRTLPLAPPPPTVGAGAHLGYAVQWISFALITGIGYAALLRRVGREEGRADPNAG
ncbi:SURF1 family protein [soil metagenome]